MEKIKLLSVIVPAYKQEQTITRDVKNLEKVLQTFPFDYEIIIVVDGFLDKTYGLLQKLKTKIKSLRVVGYEKNKGKGFAIKYGVGEAKGDVIGFIDAGMDIDPVSIVMLLNHMEWYDADIIVGSKLHPVSMVEYPFWRKVMSWGYRIITHFLFGFKVKDTQVGIKFFKKNVVIAVFPKLLVKKFAFDIELLAVAYSLGYKRIYEAPVRLRFSGNNSIPSVFSVKFWRIIFHTLWDTIAVFYRIKISNYYGKISEYKS